MEPWYLLHVNKCSLQGAAARLLILRSCSSNPSQISISWSFDARNLLVLDVLLLFCIIILLLNFFFFFFMFARQAKKLYYRQAIQNCLLTLKSQISVSFCLKLLVDPLKLAMSFFNPFNEVHMLHEHIALMLLHSYHEVNMWLFRHGWKPVI